MTESSFLGKLSLEDVFVLSLFWKAIHLPPSWGFGL